MKKNTIQEETDMKKRTETVKNGWKVRVLAGALSLGIILPTGILIPNHFSYAKSD